MTDVLIAGGGIAGSSLAIMLGRAGLRVELFERATFPREKPCGEGIMPAGVEVLKRLGLAEAVGGSPFFGVRYYLDTLSAEGRFPTHNGIPAEGRAQRRLHLDRVLFEAAANTSGVTAHCGYQVDGPIFEARRVVGLNVNGQPHRGRLIVAADGLHSRLRSALGLEGKPPRRWRVGLRAHFQLPAHREPPPWVEVFIGPDYELYTAPLPNNEVLVAGLADKQALTGNPKVIFDRWIHEQPVLWDRLQDAQPITELMGMSPLAQHPSAIVTAGAVLLGDAAGFLDPITGGGITQALLTSELLTRHILSGADCQDRWLADYDRACTALLRDYTLLTQFVVSLAEHRWKARLMLHLLKRWPTLFSHLTGVAAGIRPLLPILPPSSTVR